MDLSWQTWQVQTAHPFWRRRFLELEWRFNRSMGGFPVCQHFFTNNERERMKKAAFAYFIYTSASKSWILKLFHANDINQNSKWPSTPQTHPKPSTISWEKPPEPNHWSCKSSPEPAVLSMFKRNLTSYIKLAIWHHITSNTQLWGYNLRIPSQSLSWLNSKYCLGIIGWWTRQLSWYKVFVKSSRHAIDLLVQEPLCNSNYV